ncbi:hypothetical protein EJB05_19983, partial [Eragrostis curvula]
MQRYTMGARQRLGDGALEAHHDAAARRARPTRVRVVRQARPRRAHLLLQQWQAAGVPGPGSAKLNLQDHGDHGSGSGRPRSRGAPAEMRRGEGRESATTEGLPERRTPARAAAESSSSPARTVAAAAAAACRVRPSGRRKGRKGPGFRTGWSNRTFLPRLNWFEACSNDSGPEGGLPGPVRPNRTRPKAAAATGLRKVKEGTASGFQWIKDKYQKKNGGGKKQESSGIVGY